jgi:hypothetical protein
MRDLRFEMRVIDPGSGAIVAADWLTIDPCNISADGAEARVERHVAALLRAVRQETGRQPDHQEMKAMDQAA